MAVTSAGIRMADMLTTPVTSILMPNISYTPSAEVLETELCIANGFEAFNFLKIDSSTEIESQKNKPGLTDQEKEEIIRALWKIESSFTGSSSNEDRIIFMAAIKSAVEITKYYLNKMSDLDKEEINYKILGMKHICLHRLKLRIAQTEAQIISIRNEIQSQSARFSNSCSRSLKICQMIFTIFGFFFLKLDPVDPMDYESTTFYNITSMLGFAISACFLMISIPSNINEFDKTVCSFDTTFCGLWTFLMCTATSYLMWNMEGKRNGPSIAVVFGFIAMGCYAGNALVLIRACCKR
ncbi:uncharacterized protein LOC117181974 isoform X1 [Belonocnema kinseyi]|uniref:uncharacterized protein LOC117181974 isoform X1 n=1 Tax=Belonocnema kinseyi TaxID=2817044 RepID=UPI00143DDCA5|nr:uncharacterized protein LOC117181974 isoform X1 [Belonocnema kinseyi]XP_033230888.1 uncharacterized protein LOC117181974 isoform X1 [Belonocnema kinseyi]